MATKLTYTVEAINRPYGASESIPWGDARRTEGLTERKATKRTDARKWAHRGSLAVPGVVWTVRDAKGCLVSQHYERPDDPPAIPTLVSHR
jgi:hypothetical protein